MKLRCLDIGDLNGSFLELGKEYEVHSYGTNNDVYLVGNCTVPYCLDRFNEVRGPVKVGDILRCINMDHVDGSTLEIGKEYKVDQIVDECTVIVEGNKYAWSLYHFRPVVLYPHLTPPCNNCHYGLRLPTQFPCNRCNEVNGNMCYTLPRSDSPKRDEPGKGEFYFYTYDICGQIRSNIWTDSDLDRYLLSINDISKTLSEAEGKLQRRIIRARLEKFAEQNNESNHTRYTITYKPQGDRLMVVLLMNSYDTVSFSSESIAERAIKEIGEEKLKEYYKYFI